ncbi:MAG: hypothetical protein DMG58_23555 [Acidobacteria bacterium]|nr:MAG: hypothetical protein DMG58_23555 [Acidobacteriota bacterium]
MADKDNLSVSKSVRFTADEYKDVERVVSELDDRDFAYVVRKAVKEFIERHDAAKGKRKPGK